MSNANSWLDFAQRSREEGGLGLQKHQAAGVVGNLVNESGPDIPAWGPTGDNGTAWGSAQWRGDRLTGLQAHARENGLDYKTPEAQQAWMRRELDTTENRAFRALQAATTPEEAARAFDQHYERSDGRTIGKREASARQFFGGEGPTAIDQAMGRTPSGSPRMAYGQETPPALYPQQPQGALSYGGSPVAQPSWLETLGQTLKDVAPGIAQDPDNKNALIKAAESSRKVAGQGTWSTHIDPKTGIATQTNSLNPLQRQQFQAQPPQVEKPEKVDPSAMKYVADEVKAMTMLHNSAQQADRFRTAIDNGSLDLSIAGQAGANFDNVFGKGSEKARLYNDFQSFRTQAANDSLRQNSGVQTEGDATRAAKELTGSFTGQFDNKSISAALDNYIKKAGSVALKSATDATDSYSSAYTNKAPFEVHRKSLEEQRKFYDEYGKRAPAAVAAPAGAASKPFNPADVKWNRN
jgi:hypothetical protein